MNSAVRRFTLFFFSLATLASCEDPSDLGLDLQDENQIGIADTTLAVNTGTVLHADSVLAYKLEPMPVGGYVDATLGNVTATAFTEVGLTGTEVSFGTSPVADSLVLTLDYTTDIYGAKNVAPLALNVHRLTEGFQDKASYFTSSSLSYDSNVLGSVSFSPKVLETKKTKQDSIAPVRIKLDKALATELLAQSGKDPLKDQFKFAQFFKGIAIVPSQDAPREIIGINTNSGSRTRITLYYKNDTTRKEYNFTLSGSNIRNFSKITTDRTGTALEGLQKYVLLPSTATGGETYVQASTQLFTKLNIPGLEALKKKNGTIVLNRAELIIPVKTNSFGTLLAPKQLGLFETNNTNRILYAFKGEPKTVPMDNASVLDSYGHPTVLLFKQSGDSEAVYKVNITAYVQAILRGDKPNDGLLITPANFVPNQNGGGSIFPVSLPKRAILSNTAGKGAELRIYYSKLD